MTPTAVLRHSLTSGEITLSEGLFTVRVHGEAVFDLPLARRLEEARRDLLPGTEGVVLVWIPADIAWVEPEALRWLGSPEAMEGVLGRAVVVPSSFQALRDSIRWRLFKPSVAFRVFGHARVAKSWLMDLWVGESVGPEIDSWAQVEISPSHSSGDVQA